MILHPAVVFRLQLVASRAEFGIFRQPSGVLLDEFSVRGALHVLRSPAHESLAYIVHLGLEYSRPVDFRQRIELLLELVEFDTFLDSDGLEIHVYRVKGECGDGAVGVGVLPFTLSRGVGDRQHLDDALPGRGRPVHEGVQILELTYSEVIVASQREDRNEGSGTAEARPVEHGRLMGSRERAARDGAVYPLVLYDFRRLGGVVRLPFRAPYQALAHHHVSVLLQGFAPVVLHRHAPDSSVVPVHRVSFPSEQQHQAVAPLGHVLNLESCLHIVISFSNYPTQAAALRFQVRPPCMSATGA